MRFSKSASSVFLFGAVLLAQTSVHWAVRAQDAPSGDLGALTGLSSGEIAEKIAADPLLLRRLIGNKGEEDESSTQTCTPGAAGCPYTEDITIRTKNSLKSPPGVEFLGVGYNMLVGNPRGTFSSQVDPGFGFPVIDVSSKENAKNRKARGYAPPDVAYLNGGKTCTMTQRAADLSNAQDYQETLSKEAKDTTSKAFGATIGDSLSFDISNSFSKSEKYDSFTKTTTTEKTNSFENKATCIDFELGINPYEELTLDGTFNMAVADLPSPYDANNSEHRAKYSKFLAVYGTHYVNALSMGGKYIVTSHIKTSEVMKLARENVDVSTELNFEVSFGIEKEKEKKKEDKPKAECCGGTLQFPPTKDEPKKEDNKVDDVKSSISPFKIEASFKFDSTRKTTNNVQRNDDVTSKITSTEKYTIGGAPPTGDTWEAWAATIKDNPMPVEYDLTPLWEIPVLAAKVDAYVDAVKDIYGIDFLAGPTHRAINSFRFGVASRSGSAITRYNTDPDSFTRAYLELGLFPAASVEARRVTVYNPLAGGGHHENNKNIESQWYPADDFLEAEQVGFYACGFQAKWDKNEYDPGYGADLGLDGLKVTFCSIDDWFKQETKLVYEGGDRGKEQPVAMCPINHWIVQLRPLIKFGSGDELGINRLEIKCTDIEGDWVKPLGSGPDGFFDIVDSTFDDSEQRQGIVPDEVAPNTLISGVRVQVGGFSGDWHGIHGMEVKFTTAVTGGGPKKPFYYYDMSFDATNDQVKAVFSTPVRGKTAPSAKEDMHDLGFVKGKKIDLESSVRYGFMSEPTRAKIGVSDFQGALNVDDLPSFTFLTVNDLPRGEEYEIIAGVVHPDGYAAEDIFASRFKYEVSLNDADKTNVFTVKFDALSFSGSPTFVTFPLWFPTIESRFPTNLGDVSVASRGECVTINDKWECEVVVGTSSNPVAANHLGFSFLAIGDTDPAAPILHGRVSVDPLNLYSDPTVHSPSPSGGFTARAQYSSEATHTVTVMGDEGPVDVTLTARTGGTLIEFQRPFKDIPSIIASPVLDEEGDLHQVGADEFVMPYLVIEHITRNQAFIKAGVVDTKTHGAYSYKPISFDIFIIGPEDTVGGNISNSIRSPLSSSEVSTY